MGFFSRTISVRPLATAPASLVALPSSIFRAPTMSRKRSTRSDCHDRGKDPLERMNDVSRRHGRATGKASILADRERVRPAVPRDDRIGLRELRRHAEPCRGPLVRVGHQAAARRTQEWVCQDGKRGIDRTEFADRDANPERAALLDPARAPGCGEEECCANNQPCDGQGPAHCVRDGTRPTAASKGRRGRWLA